MAKIVNPINKLGKLEDIEEEIGVGLLILFEALKNGIYYKDKYGITYYRNVRGIETYGLSVIDDSFPYAECDFTAYYVDYRKTWGLTKEDFNEK